MRTIVLFFLFTQVLSAQQLSIKGQVLSLVDAYPLIGASISSSIDTVVSDIDGQFLIQVEEESKQVLISYIGFEQQKIDLENSEDLLIVKLSPSNNILETAIISASMTEQNIAVSTVSIEVLKPSIIQTTNSQSLDETLNLLPGVEIIDGQASIRGGSGYSYGAGSRVLLLIDNIPALQPDAGFPSWNDIALENIAQVEVVKGASSALYGSSALNGVINVRYAQPGSEPETKASINYTTFGKPKDLRSQWWDSSPYAFGANLLHKQKFKKYDLVAGVQYYQLESFREATQQKRGRLILNNRYRLNERSTIGVNVVGNISDNSSFIFWENALRGAYRPFAGTEVSSLNNRWIVDPYFTHFDKAGNKHKVQGRLYYIDNGTANGLDNFSLLNYGEYQFQRNLKDRGLTITSGITGTSTNIEAGLYGGASYRSQNAGIYTQIDKKIYDRLNLSFGGRYEYNSLRNSEIDIVDGDFTENVEANFIQEAKPVFRFGLNYQSGKATFLRASIGQGYRFPTIAEKFTTVGLASFRIFTNADLQSEIGWSSEIGIKQGLKLGQLYAFLDFAAFWSEYDDMMEFLLTGKNGVFGFQSSNIGDTRIRGIDMNFTGQLGTSKFPISFITGYTYLDPRYKKFNENIAASSSEDFNVLKYRSLHNVKLDVEASAFGFSLGVNAKYVSHMQAIDGEFNLFIPGLRNFRSVNNKGYYLLNLRTAYKFRDYRISVIMNNVLNAAYTVRPALLEAPRNLSLRLDAKF